MKLTQEQINSITNAFYELVETFKKNLERDKRNFY